MSDGEFFDENPNPFSSTLIHSDNINKLRESAVELANIENPTNSDVIKAIIKSMDIQITTLTEINSSNQKISNLSNEINKIKTDVKKDKKDFENEKSKQNEFNAQILNKVHQNTAEINYINQAKIDAEIYIGGFTEKPEVSNAIEVFCGHYDIPRSSIAHAYSFETGTDRERKGFLIIRFQSKTEQIQFKEKKKSKPAITINQIQTENPVPVAVNKGLFCAARLTPVNQEISKKLRDLLENDKIKDIKYKNCFFQVKQFENSAYIPVPTLQFLEELIGIDDESQ